MKLDTLHALDVPALWAGLQPRAQAEIGTAALAQQLALLVAEDNGEDTTWADRFAASDLADAATNGLADAIEAALPDIAWWSP